MAVIATAEPYNIPILNSANGALAETLEAVGNNAGLLGDVMQICMSICESLRTSPSDLCHRIPLMTRSTNARTVLFLKDCP
jgi:hypothetical protein